MIRGGQLNLTTPNSSSNSSSNNNNNNSHLSSNAFTVGSVGASPPISSSSSNGFSSSIMDPSLKISTSQPFKFNPSPVSSPTSSFSPSNSMTSTGNYSPLFLSTNQKIGNRLNISLTHQEETKPINNKYVSNTSFVSNSSGGAVGNINRKNMDFPLSGGFSPIRGANNLFKKSWRNSSGGFCCNLSYFVLGIIFFISLLTFVVFMYYSVKNRQKGVSNSNNGKETNVLDGKHSESSLVLSSVQDFFTRLRAKNEHRLKNVPLEEGYSQYFEHEKADQETLERASDKLTKEMRSEMLKVKEFYKATPIQKVFVAVVNDHSQVMSALILAKKEQLIPSHLSLPILHVDSHSGHKIIQHSKTLPVFNLKKKKMISKIEKMTDINNFISTSQYYGLLGGHVIWVHNDWRGSKFSMPRGRHTAILSKRSKGKKGKPKICYKNMRGIFWDGTPSDLTFETMADESGKIYKNEKAVCSKSERLAKQKHVRWDIYSMDQISRLNHHIFNNTPYILHLNEDFFASSDPTLASLLPRGEFGHLFDMLATLLSPKNICYSKPIKVPTREGMDRIWTNEEQNREWISKIVDELFFRGLIFEEEGTRAPRFSFYSAEVLEMWCAGPKVALEELKKINKLVLIMLDNIPFYTLSLLRYEYDFPTISEECIVNNLFGVCPSARSPAHESSEVDMRRDANALKDVIKREGLPALVIISRSNKEGFTTSNNFFNIEHMALSAVEKGLAPTPMLLHYLNGAKPATPKDTVKTQEEIDYEQEFNILQHVIESEMHDLSTYAALMSDRIEKFKQMKKFIKYKELRVLELFYEGQDLLKEFITQVEENLRFETPIVKTPYQSPKTRIRICINMIGVSNLLPPYLKCLVQRMRQEKRINFLVSEKLVETSKEFRQVIGSDTQISKVSHQVKEDKFILLMDLGCDNVNKVLVQTERGLTKYFGNMQQTVDGKLIHDIMQSHTKSCRK